MDKPRSMSVKDFLIRTLAVKILVSESVIEAVINHQFQSTAEAMLKHNSVEIGGFGKFYFNVKKAKKRLDELYKKKAVVEATLASPTLSEQRRKTTNVILENTFTQIKNIEDKITYEPSDTDIRGMEK